MPVRPRQVLVVVGVLAVTLGGLVPLAPLATAAGGAVVSSCTESALRSAVAGGGRITFSCAGTIEVTSPLVIPAGTTIDGGNSVAVSGNKQSQIATVAGGTVVLENITLVDGLATPKSGDNGADGGDGTAGAGGKGGVQGIRSNFAPTDGTDGTAGTGGTAGNGGTAGRAAQGGALAIAKGSDVTLTNVSLAGNQAVGGDGGNGGQGGNGGFGGGGGGGGGDGEGELQPGGSGTVGGGGPGGVGSFTTSSGSVSGTTPSAGGAFGPGSFVIDDVLGDYPAAAGGNGGAGGKGGVGGNGGAGGTGGAAAGGAIYNAGTLTITGSTFSDNEALGGYGGTGGQGGAGGEGGEGGSAGRSGQSNNGTIEPTDPNRGGAAGTPGVPGSGGTGGTGGTATGGAIDNLGTLHVSASTFATNRAEAGIGSMGGAGGVPGQAVGGVPGGTDGGASRVSGTTGPSAEPAAAGSAGHGGAGALGVGGAIANAATADIESSSFSGDQALGGIGGPGGGPAKGLDGETGIDAPAYTSIVGYTVESDPGYAARGSAGGAGANGSDGGTGGNGAGGFGGGIDTTTGAGTTIAGLSFSGEKAGGGDGGDGGDAGDGGAGANGGRGGSVQDFYDIEPGDGGAGGAGGKGGDAGDGGNGGAALGGAIYGGARLNGPAPTFDDSELTGGQEGNGSETRGKGGTAGKGGDAGTFAFTDTQSFNDDKYKHGTPPPNGVAGAPGKAGSTGLPGDDGIQGSEGNDKDVYGVITQTAVAVDVTVAELASVSYGTAIDAAVSVTTTSSVGAPPKGDSVVVTATQGGVTKATCTATLPGTADDYASCSLPGTLTVGTYAVTATLQGAGSAGGDAGYVATTSTPTGLVVVAVPTSTALTSLAPATLGSPAPVGVTVSGATGPAPGGQPVTITAAQGGVPRATCTATLTTGTRATGTCSLPSTLALGDYSVTATYAGDVDFTGSSTTGTLAITDRTTISTTVPDPTVFTGSSVTYSATVAATSGTPTGTVTFSASHGGSDVVLCSTTALTAGKAGCASSAAPLGTDTITATFVGTGGQAPSRGTTTLTVEIAPPVAPAGATASDAATGVDPNGKETASVTGFSATGLGVGAFTVSLYGSNPTGTALSNGTGRFVDVLVATGSQLASLTLTDCDLGAGGNFLSWYDGRRWQAFSAQTKDSPNPGCITAVVDGTTSPTLAQLTGTVIGASDKPTGDFALSLDPTSQILSENSSVLYTVQAITSSGFTDPVTLTVADLPVGVTGFFVGSGSDHVTVTPGTPTQLHLSAGQSFTTGTYGFTVTGTGAGLTHSVDGSVKLSFGLVPRCYAEVVGDVIDSVTGDPVSAAQVDVGFTTSVTTDEHGHYDTGMTVELGQNLSSQQVHEGITSYDYYSGSVQPSIGCDLVTTQNVTLTKRRFGSIAGHAYVGVPDPSDPTDAAKVIPTSTPITSHLAVRIDGGNTGVPLAQVDGNGRYEIDGVSLAAPDNSPANHTVDLVDGVSYWVGPTQEVQVSAGRQTIQDLIGVPVCTGTIRVHAYSSDTGRVEVGADVHTGDPTGATPYATTDAQGDATLTVALGYLNSPGTYDVDVLSSDGAGTTAPIRVDLSGCGATASVQAPVHVPVVHYGNITATVLDASTRQPLEGANVQAFCQTGGAQSTDAHGVATVDHLQVGTDSTTSATCGVVVGDDGYYNGSATPAVFADRTATVTVLLTRRLPGVLSGTVTDVDTGQPVAHALVDAGDVETSTDGAGRYAISDNRLLSSSVPNGSNTIDVSARTTDGTYLPSASKKVTITAGTPAVADFTLIPQCGVATVTGAVYNATNEQPIPDAEVIESAGGSLVHTDANGAFALQVKVYGNTPFTDQLEAAAAGFFPAYDNVTLFCGAHVVVNFGQNATRTGAVSGTVTDEATGHPVAGAFVGASWGGATTTAADGSYSLTGVPLGNGDAAQTWTVTVQPPSGSPLQPTVVPVTVAAAPPTTMLDVALGTTPPPTVTAVDHTYTTPSRTTPLTVAAPGLLAGDAGTDLVVTASEPTDNGGSVTTAPDGAFVFTPNAFDNQGNTGTFTYTVTDAYGTNATGSVTVVIGTTAPAPRADADSATTAFEVPHTVADPGVLANDTGTGLHVTAHTDPVHGTVSIAGTGGYTYTPAGGYAGADAFRYTVTDSSGRTASATVSITVSPPSKPVAASYQESTAFQTPLVVPAADGVLSNSTGTRITLTAHTAPGHGTVDIAGTGAYTYTPGGGFSGEDAFTYTVTDAVGATATGTVTIAVGTGLPPAPVAHADSGSTAFETPLVVATPGLLGNDTGTGIAVTGHTGPAHGTVTTTADGGYTYTPATGYAGPDAFAYTITDSAHRTSTATASIKVSAPPQPVAGTYQESTAYQTPLDVDAADGLLSKSTGTRIAVTGHTASAHGTVTTAASGAWTYVPAEGFSGDDAFSYTVTDAIGATSTGTVRIVVSPRGLPPAPLAAADTYATPYATTLTVAAPGVLGNDTGSVPVTVTSHVDPSHGTLDLASDGSLTYVPADGFSGPDTFAYTITDSTDRTSTAQVTITVGEKPQPVVPTITDVSPSHGPAAGGDLVTVTGTGFTGATSVTIGRTVLAQLPKLPPAAAPVHPALTPLFSVVSDTEITLVDPPGSGTVDIRVTTASGTSPVVAADRFTYDPPHTTPPTSSAPTSSAPSGPTATSGPTSGSTTGGTGSLASTGFDALELTWWGVLLAMTGGVILCRTRRPYRPRRH